MNFINVLLSASAALAINLSPVQEKKEELPPVPDNMCAQVTMELLIAVENGYISEEVAEEVGGRCFRIWGDRLRSYK